MSEHTKGRLRLEQSKSGQRFLYSDAHRDPLCDVLRATVTLTPGEGEANARRLAACWNAFEGLDTEQIEDDPFFKLHLALEKLANAVETRKPEHEGYLVKCAEEARALLAKHTPKVTV